MKNDLEIHRSHNVYILGAGFSRDAGLPLISDFLDQMRESVNWLEDQGRQRELEAVKKVFQFRREAASSAYRTCIDLENIEDLFSLASASEGTSNDEYISTAIAATLDYARAIKCSSVYRLRVNEGDFSPPSNWQYEQDVPPTDGFRYFRAPVHDLYAGILSGALCKKVPGMRNTVITFNYDTLLEESLDNLKMPFNYYLPMNSTDYHESALHIGGSLLNPSALKVLKLHGSMNWAIRRESETQFSLSVYANYSGLVANNQNPYLLPPTWRKVFTGALGNIWNAALKALTEATRIIVIGFSVPPTDQHFKYLLAAGLKDNISLRDVIFVSKDDAEGKAAEALRANVANVFHPILNKKIEWKMSGVQHALGDANFLNKIERRLYGSFSEIAPFY